MFATIFFLEKTKMDYITTSSLSPLTQGVLKRMPQNYKMSMYKKYKQGSADIQTQQRIRPPLRT